MKHVEKCMTWMELLSHTKSGYEIFDAYYFRGAKSDFENARQQRKDFLKVCADQGNTLTNLMEDLDAKMKQCRSNLSATNVVKRSLLPTWTPEYEDVIYSPFRESTKGRDSTDLFCRPNSYYLLERKLFVDAVLLQNAINETEEIISKGIPAAKACANHALTVKYEAFKSYVGYGGSDIRDIKTHCLGKSDDYEKRIEGINGFYYLTIGSNTSVTREQLANSRIKLLNCIDDLLTSGYTSNEAHEACIKAK